MIRSRRLFAAVLDGGLKPCWTAAGPARSPVLAALMSASRPFRAEHSQSGSEDTGLVEHSRSGSGYPTEERVSPRWRLIMG